ncbi:MAG: PilN domain-containing protein [Gammaproteobacteria bacterium]|nr:PilN domain-containing protein [Gammaproteobacteria bacterium]
MQQINLYQHDLRPEREFLPMALLGIAGAATLGVLLLINAMQWVLTHRGETTLITLHNQQQQIQTQLQLLQQQLQQIAAQNNAQTLQTQLAGLDAELQNKHQVLQRLSDKRVGNVDGFATQFSGLARQRLEGLWLTGLYIHEGGEKLNLRGSTTRPELLPKYLQRLAQEPSFHGIEFKSFVMQRAKDKPQIDFDLRATPQEKIK